MKHAFTVMTYTKKSPSHMWVSPIFPVPESFESALENTREYIMYFRVFSYRPDAEDSRQEYIASGAFGDS